MLPSMLTHLQIRSLQFLNLRNIPINTSISLLLRNVHKNCHSFCQISYENKTNLAFALGKAYEDIKNFDKSFNLYKEANAIYRKTISYSLDKEKEKFSEIKSTFHHKLYEKYKKSGSTDKSSIFIFLPLSISGFSLMTSRMKRFH